MNKVLAIDLGRSSVVRDRTYRYVKLITWPGGSGSAFVSNDLQVYRRHALRTITQSIWLRFNWAWSFNVSITAWESRNSPKKSTVNVEHYTVKLRLDNSFLHSIVKRKLYIFRKNVLNFYVNDKNIYRMPLKIYFSRNKLRIK